MTENDLTDRFTHDVDCLLNASVRKDPEQAPTEYRQILDLAHTLTAADFSTQSQVRETLRHRLLNQVGTREGWKTRKENLMNIYLQHSLRRRLLAAIGGALVLLLVMMVLYPGGPAAAAKSISAGVKMIILGSYSRAQQVEAFIKGEPPPDDIWKISVFPGYTVGGNGPPGIHLEVVTVANLTEAQEQVAFQIQTPGYLPEGYTLREIKLAPVWTGLGEVLFPNNPTAFLIYNGPGSDIAIIQQPVGPEPTGDHNVAVGRAVGFMTDGSLVEVDLEGRTAAWADEMLLMWEEDGFSYTVGGPELSLEDAIRVAVTLN